MSTLTLNAALIQEERHNEITEQLYIDGRISTLNHFQQYSDKLKILNLVNVSETDYIFSLPQSLTQLTLNNCSINNLQEIPCKDIQFLTVINCGLNDIIGIDQFKNLKQANFQYNNIISLKGVLQHKNILTFNILDNPIMNKFKNDQLEIISQAYFPNIKIFNNQKTQSIQFSPIYDFQHLLAFYGLIKVHYEQVSYSQQQSIKFMIDYQQNNVIKLDLGNSGAQIKGVYLVKFLTINEDITNQFDNKTNSLTLNKQQMQTDQKLVAVIELNQQIILLASFRSSKIQLSESKPQIFKKIKISNYEELRGKEVQFIQVINDMVVSDKNEFIPFQQGFYKINLTTIDNQLIQYQFYVNDTQNSQLSQEYLSNNAFSYIANYLGCNILCANGKVHLISVDQNFFQFLIDSDIWIQINWKFINQDGYREENTFNNYFVLTIPEKYINFNIEVTITFYSILSQNIIGQQIIKIQDKIIQQPKLVNYYRFIRGQSKMSQLQEDILNNTYQLIMFNSDMQSNSILELQVHKMLLFEQNIYKVIWFTSELNLFQILNLQYFQNIHEDIKYFKKYKFENNVLTLSYENPISGLYNDLQFIHKEQSKDTPYYNITNEDVQKFILVFINYKYVYISHIPVMQDCKFQCADLERIHISVSDNNLQITYSDQKKIPSSLSQLKNFDNDTFESENLLKKYSFSSTNLLIRQQEDSDSQHNACDIKLNRQKNVITYSCHDITANITYSVLTNNENISVPVKYESCQLPFSLSYNDMYESIKQLCNKFTQRVSINLCVGIRNKVFDIYSEKNESFIIFNKLHQTQQSFLQQTGINYNFDISNINFNNTVIQQSIYNINAEKLMRGDCEYSMIFNVDNAIQPTFNVITNQLNIDVNTLQFTGEMTVNSMIDIKNLCFDSAFITGFIIPGVKQVEENPQIYSQYIGLLYKIVPAQNNNFAIFNTSYLTLKDKYLNKYIYFFIINKDTQQITVIMLNNPVTLRNIVEQIYISHSSMEIMVLYKSIHSVILDNSFLYFSKAKNKILGTSCLMTDHNEQIITFPIDQHENIFSINLTFDDKIQFILNDVSLTQNTTISEKISYNNHQIDQLSYHNYVYVNMSPGINSEAAKFMKQQKESLQTLLEPDVTVDVYDAIDLSENVSVSIL